ncbi:hypothetical protein OAK19_03065, partial [Aureispira]|nr:hypothetical protein [Aureispira sp.]
DEFLKYNKKKDGFVNWLQDTDAGQIYRIKCLPAHIQLAEKMRRRGGRIDAGSRLEYLVTTLGGLKGKQFEKIEDPVYQQEHSDLIKIDCMYYLHLLINPLDEVLKVAYNIENLIKEQYKLRTLKFKINRKIEEIFEIKISFL